MLLIVGFDLHVNKDCEAAYLTTKLVVEMRVAITLPSSAESLTVIDEVDDILWQRYLVSSAEHYGRNDFGNS